MSNTKVLMELIVVEVPYLFVHDLVSKHLEPNDERLTDRGRT